MLMNGGASIFRDGNIRKDRDRTSDYDSICESERFKWIGERVYNKYVNTDKYSTDSKCGE
jgi:hypothetical protein